MYFSPSKKTRVINSFIRTRCIKPRDIFARYGARVNPNGGYSTDQSTSATPAVQGTSVIQSMIIGQNTIKSALAAGDDLPPD